MSLEGVFKSHVQFYNPEIWLTWPGRGWKSKYACFWARNKICHGQPCAKFLVQSTVVSKGFKYPCVVQWLILFSILADSRIVPLPPIFTLVTYVYLGLKCQFLSFFMSFFYSYFVNSLSRTEIWSFIWQVISLFCILERVFLISLFFHTEFLHAGT